MAFGADDVSIGVDIDPSKAESGAKATANAIGQVGNAAQQAAGQFNQLGSAAQQANALFGTDTIGSAGLQSTVRQTSQAFGLLGVNMGGTLQGFLALNPEIAAVAIPVGLLFKGVTDLAGGVFDLGEKLVGIGWDVFHAGVEDAIGLVEQLTGRMEDLAVQGVEGAFSVTQMSEKSLVNLGFLWGGVQTNPALPGYGTGPGMGPATDLLQWSKQASLSMPWTRQDLMQALNIASITGGVPVPTVEHDLTVLSDVAATQGRTGINLQWAAMAAMRGGQGYGRMLLMELGLTKDELAQFGYDEGDPNTLYPALEGYAKSKGSLGGSAFIAQNTLWGAQTSMVDRLQNFGLGMMGWNDNPTSMTDDVKKGSPYWYLKQDLAGLAKWMDTHQDELTKWGDLFGRVLGGGLGAAGSALQGLLGGLNSSGLTDFLEKTIKALGDFLNDPNTQKALAEIGDVVGGVLGAGIQDLGTALQTFGQAVANSGLAQELFADLQRFGQWLQSPEGKQAFKEFGDIMGNIVGPGLKTAWDAAKGFAQGLQDSGLVTAVANALQGLGTWLADPVHQAEVKEAARQIGQDLGNAIQGTAGFAWVAAQAFGVFFDTLAGGTSLIGDLARVMSDFSSGNLVQLALDTQQLNTDWSNFQKTLGETPDFVPPWMKTGPGGSGGGADVPGASHGMAGGKHQPGGDYGASGMAATRQAGQQHAQTYLLAFHQTMQQQTQAAVVDPLMDALGRQVAGSGAGQQVAAAILAVVQGLVGQSVTTELAGYARGLGNAGKVPGGYRPAGAGVGGLL